MSNGESKESDELHESTENAGRASGQATEPPPHDGLAAAEVSFPVAGSHHTEAAEDRPVPEEGSRSAEPLTAEAPAPAVHADETAAPAGGLATPEATIPAAGAEPGAPAGEAAAKPRRARNPFLVRAYRTGRPIEGKVAGVIKGGYEIKVGRARGFCPHSQIALVRENTPERHIGESYLFKVIQLRRGGEDAVLSRRVVLEDERVDEAKAVRATLVEGHVMQGHVAGTAEFGAFVDLGAGVMGLVHISELSRGRVDRVEDAVHVGDTVQVKILKVDDAKGRISLSIRQATEDPWKDAAERFQIGSTYPGSVARLADFGAFVELAPGIEALAPASELPPLAGSWRDELQPGTQRDWLVLSVVPRQRRISLTLPVEGAEPTAISAGNSLSGRIQRVERFGVFVWLAPGRVGLLPRAWSGTPAGTDLARQFSPGQSIEVTVVEVADEGQRIRLTKKGVEPTAAEPREAREPRREREGGRERERPRERERGRKSPVEETPAEAQVSFGTSLADKLRAALDKSR